LRRADALIDRFFRFYWNFLGDSAIHVKMFEYIIPPPVPKFQLVKLPTISYYFLEKAQFFLNLADIFVVSKVSHSGGVRRGPLFQKGARQPAAGEQPLGRAAFGTRSAALKPPLARGGVRRRGAPTCRLPLGAQQKTGNASLIQVALPVFM
jgi:hypothetical protein